MIERIEKVHEERIIHRDIKPDNFLIGGTEVTKDNIYVIDFGLAKCYKIQKEHIFHSLKERTLLVLQDMQV